jgi:hypothetical protein
MDAHRIPEASPKQTDQLASGSAWAELDETFFRVVQDAFSHDFCEGAGVLLGLNDDDSPDVTIVIPPARLSHEAVLEQLNQEIDRELELRRETMRRHPSRRRF